MIRENLLHFIWEYQKIPIGSLVTSAGERITILNKGQHNHLSGPDFFNAQIVIGEQRWAGNVEMHLKASDWYVHGHERDSRYANVILHVVWEEDMEILRNANMAIPTLILKNYVTGALLDTYNQLFNKKEFTFVNCEKDLKDSSSFLIKNWTDRLFFERLEKKTDIVMNLLDMYKNDWEQVLFVLLLKNFGSTINGAAFYEIGKKLKFSMIRKLQGDIMQLESILYGTADLLSDSTISDQYHRDLREEYLFLKTKWKLRDSVEVPLEFFKLRPSNFPTIRLSQFAGLYHKKQQLFGEVIAASTIAELYAIFDVTASAYWKTHYTFGKVSKGRSKRLSKKFIDLLIVNTVIPLKFCYARCCGEDIGEMLTSIAVQIKKEENGILRNFERIGMPVDNAMDSQAVLQLYHAYCRKNKCLQCAIGNDLLKL